MEEEGNMRMDDEEDTMDEDGAAMPFMWHNLEVQWRQAVTEAAATTCKALTAGTAAGQSEGWLMTLAVQLRDQLVSCIKGFGPFVDIIEVRAVRVGVRTLRLAKGLGHIHPGSSWAAYANDGGRPDLSAHTAAMFLLGVGLR
jgi:hypothetical protein